VSSCSSGDAVAVDNEVTRCTALLLTVSAQVTPVAGAPGMWWVGVGGAEQGGPGERNLAHALARLARRWHPAPHRHRELVRGGTRRGLGRRAARGGGGGAAGELTEWVRIVPRGACAAFIADAPIGSSR
jgi:hypothetical protein